VIEELTIENLRNPFDFNPQTRLPLRASPPAEHLCHRKPPAGKQSEAARGTSGQVTQIYWVKFRPKSEYLSVRFLWQFKHGFQNPKSSIPPR